MLKTILKLSMSALAWYSHSRIGAFVEMPVLQTNGMARLLPMRGLLVTKAKCDRHNDIEVIAL
jgi:hypothetical protein